MNVRSVLGRLLATAVTGSLAVLAAPAAPAVAKSNFTARPFMGWSSWSVESSTRPGYGQAWLNQTNIENAANAVATKLKSAGYSYINIDAGWNATQAWVFHTDVNGIPDADTSRFPNGLAPVAGYIHNLGLNVGVYMAAGLEKEVYNKNAPILGTNCTTQQIAVQPLTPTNIWGETGSGGNWKVDYGNPCAQAYFNSIANRFASWGIDFVKVDGTAADNAPDIQAWSKAIDQSGRAMWLTASGWPVPHSAATALQPYANGVRVDTDVECYCNTASSWTSSVSARWSDLPAWTGNVGPGYWPDLDSMPINNNTGSGLQDGLSDTERQSTMTFWSMASAPLYVGGDVYFEDSTATAILTNPEVIAVDQAGVIPTQVSAGSQPLWKKRLADGSTVVAVYNLGSSAGNITVNWSALGLGGTAAVRDLVSRTDLGSFTGSWTASNVPAHGSRLIRLTGAGDVTGGPITGIAGKCVDDNGGNTADGTKITLWTCNGGTNQYFTHVSGTYQVLGKCATVTGGGTTNNTPIQLWTCNGSASQQWTAPGDGTLRNPVSGRCLDDAGGGTGDGNTLVIWDCNGGTNQQWNAPA